MNGIEIHSQYAAIPFEVIKQKWGFVPTEAHLTESPKMQIILRELVSIITKAETLPNPLQWKTVAFDDGCVLISW